MQPMYCPYACCGFHQHANIHTKCFPPVNLTGIKLVNGAGIETNMTIDTGMIIDKIPV